MVRTLKARYENGVLLPLEKVDLPEGSTVEIALAPQGWSDRMRTLLAEVWARSGHLPPEEIEAEITRAAEEVRRERLSQP